MKKFLVSLVLLVFVVGCQTPYQKQGLGGGYSDEKIGFDMYVVTFRANERTPDTKIYGYLHKRAAEVASQLQYRYYAVTANHSGLGGQRNESMGKSSDKVRFITIKCYRQKPGTPGLDLYEVGDWE